MRVLVKYFALFRERTGKSEEWVELPINSTIYSLIDYLRMNYGFEINSLPMYFSVNFEYCDEKRKLNDGDEVGILYPPSGG